MRKAHLIVSLFLLPVLAVSIYAKGFVVADISLNGGAEHSYDLVNEPIKIYSSHGMFEYPMDAVRKIWRGVTGSVVQVETTAGDKIEGNLITENLPYLFFDEKKWVEIKEDVVFSIALRENAVMNLPADHMVVELIDGSVLVCREGHQSVDVEIEEQAFELPLASVMHFLVQQNKSEQEDGSADRYQFVYAGNGTLTGRSGRRFQKMTLTDFFDHRLELPIDSIAKISSALYGDFSECCPAVRVSDKIDMVMTDGRTETVRMPFCFFDFSDASRNAFRIPSFYVNRIVTEDGETTIRTIFGDDISGRMNSKAYHIEVRGNDATNTRNIEVSADSVSEFVFQERATPRITAPIQIRQGKQCMNGGGVSEVSARIVDEDQETRILNDLRATLIKKSDTLWLYSEEFADGREVVIDARSLDFVSFCDGERHALRWRDIDRVLFSGGVEVPDMASESVEGEDAGQGEIHSKGHQLTSEKHPRMRAGHVLQIHVLVSGETEIDEPERRITSSGEISLPLLGSVKVDAFTLEELEAYLVECYKEYLRNPQVVVQYVMNEEDAAVSPWGSVTVLGTVKEPGKVNIPPTQDLTVSMAIQQAGGYDKSANDKAIKVTRMAQDSTVQYEVNLRNAGARGAMGEDMLLQPGDVVYVPEMMF